MSLIQFDERLYGKEVHSRQPWRHTKSQQAIVGGEIDATTSWVEITSSGAVTKINGGKPGQEIRLSCAAGQIVLLGQTGTAGEDDIEVPDGFALELFPATVARLFRDETTWKIEWANAGMLAGHIVLDDNIVLFDTISSGTAVLINPAMNLLSRTRNWDFPADGQIQYVGETNRLAQIRISGGFVSSTNNVDFDVEVYKNGVATGLIAEFDRVRTDTVQSLNATFPVIVVPNDTFDLRVTSGADMELLDYGLLAFDWPTQPVEQGSGQIYPNAVIGEFSDEFTSEFNVNG